MLSNASLLQLLESTYDIVFVCGYSPVFHYEYISDNVENILGYRAEEIYKDPEIRNRIIHKEDIFELRNSINSGEKSHKKILRYYHKDGSVIFLDTSYSLIMDDNGNVEKMFGLTKKITEYSKNNYNDFIQSQEVNRIIHQDYGVLKVDSYKHEINYVNKKICEILCCSEEDLLGKNINDAICCFDFSPLENESKEELRKINDKYGKTIYLNFSFTKIYDVFGLQTNYIFIIKDVTQDKMQEIENINHRNKIQTIFNTSGHMIWTVSEDITITSYNQNFLSSSTSIPTPAHLFDAGLNTVNINNPNYEFWIKKYTDAFSGEPTQFEIVNKDHEGNEIWAEVFLSPIYDNNGKVVEVSGLAHNITQNKKSQLQIAQSLKEKEVLLSEIHHRVKNNLQVIISILNLQANSIKDPAARTHFQECQDRIRSMANIHETLYRNKDFSNIQFSDYIRSITQSLINSYGETSKPINANYFLDAVSLNLDYSIPCGLILNELVSNSIKYAFKKNKTRNINVSLTKTNNKIAFIISDDGIGLPDKIDFRNTETLGLQLVIALVDQLNGKIELNKKEGTEFLITFTLEK
ncbi:MAG: histidine kinase dimerization/phosphoacceptor domain -containing protein [Bacteroidota bacterium]|jgi:PAS domain S-box-containing protein